MKEYVSAQTARLLKKAGYPQPKPEPEQYWYYGNEDGANIVYGINGASVSVFDICDGGEYSPKIETFFERFTYAPTITDFIKGVGSKFVSLGVESVAKLIVSKRYYEGDSLAEVLAEYWLERKEKEAQNGQ